MTSGLEIRAQIDSENLKGLLVANGGGAVALLTFLPFILGKPCYVRLAQAVLWALLSCQSGLVFALVHNRLRRICSLIYEQHKYEPPPCRIVPFRWLKSEPCVCHTSTLFMWLSLVAFVFAGVFVLVRGLEVVGTCSMSWPSSE